MAPYEDDIEQLLTEAEGMLQERHAEEALEVLERARALVPEHPWVMLFRGVAFGQLEREDDALTALLGAADAHLDDVDLQVDAARHLSLLDYPQDALVCARRAVELDAMDGGAQMTLGDALERLGRIEEALAARESALSLEPEDVDNRYALAFDYCDMGRFAEALALTERLLDELPDDSEVLHLHATCLTYEGRYEDALARWLDIERLEGAVPMVLHNRAHTLAALGRFDEALALMDQVIEAEPDLGGNYMTRALIEERMGDEGEAIADFLAALTRDHTLVDAGLGLVEVAAASDTVPVALAEIDGLIEAEPTSVTLLFTRGRLLVELGHVEEAREALEAAAKLEPAFGLAWHALSTVCGLCGDPDAALDATDRALQSFPADPGLWLTRGMCLHELKRHPEAMDCYDKAVQLDPESWAPWLHMGRLLLLELDRPTDARGALREAARLQPENDVIQWMLALCFLRLGQYAEADSQLVRVLSREPNHLQGRLVRAALHAQRGEIDDAFADLKVVTGQGYDPRLLRAEPLFKPLWSDPRFLAASREARRRR